jgi:hypothetical protein
MRNHIRFSVGLTLVLSATLLRADDAHNFPSTYKGVTQLTNVHQISEGEFPGIVVRGTSPMVYVPKTPTKPATYAPKNLAHLMEKVRPTHVLIFKNENPGADDVRNEIRALTDPSGPYQLPKSNVINIPFPWKKMEGWQKTCSQMVWGLHFITQAAKQGGRVFFHCTVGEDRTGMLAGLYRLLMQKGKYSPRDVMNGKVDGLLNPDDPGEMCSRGFAEGNQHAQKQLPPEPGATDSVAQRVRTNFMPYFTKFVFMIDKKILTEEKLAAVDQTICAKDPEQDIRYKENGKYKRAEYDPNWSGYACPKTEIDE